MVTVSYVQKFVTDLLETWDALERGETPPVRVVLASYERPVDPRTDDVKDFIKRYFRNWSEQDMRGYEDCFLPDASIQFIDARGALSTSSRAQFVAGQREYHHGARFKTVEVPETIQIRFEERFARVVVYWKLTAGPRTEKGFDHFTLMKHEGKWRIVNLAFYATSSSD